MEIIFSCEVNDSEIFNFQIHQSDLHNSIQTCMYLSVEISGQYTRDYWILLGITSYC